MKILVVGGHGFIGLNLIRRFTREGHEVTCIDLKDQLPEWIPQSFKNSYRYKQRNILLDPVDYQEFEAVVWLTGSGGPAQSIQHPEKELLNTMGFLEALKESARGDTRVVFMSSHHVLASREAGKVLSPYAIGRLANEHFANFFCELYDANVLGLRIPVCYGPYQAELGYKGIVSAFIEQLKTTGQISVFGDGGQKRSFIYIDDLVDAIDLVMKRKECGCFELYFDEVVTIKDLAEKVIKLYERGEINYLDWSNGVLKVQPSFMQLSNENFYKTFNFIPKISMDRGLQLIKTIEDNRLF